MIVRPMKASDVPVLRSMAEASGFPYPDLGDPLVECVMVVADAQTDQPLMACAARRIVELYLYTGAFRRPIAKVHAIRMLHEAMPAYLKSLGYSSVEAFLPPAICERFKRKLLKLFGWCDNWHSITRRF